MEHNCEMVIVPMFEKVKVDSKCEAEIKYHAAHGINGISEIGYPNGTDGPMILSEIDKDEYDYLEYLPIIRFSKRFCGKEVLIKYDGYLKRQEEQVAQGSKLEKFKIPDDIDYSKLEHISSETKDKLSKIRPKTLAQASRIGGIKPADISILMVLLDKHRV